jgi:hypothetical protein
MPLSSKDTNDEIESAAGIPEASDIRPGDSSGDILTDIQPALRAWSIIDLWIKKTTPHKLT